MSFINRIQPHHLDILKEVGNIGAGHAATALSRLLNKTIDMKVPAVRVVSFNEITELVGGSDNIVAAIFLRIEGEAPGNMFFMLPVNEATTLIQYLTGDQTFDLDHPPYPDLGLSALQEVGNILAGSYLSAFSDFTKLNMQPSVPALSVDMAIAILSYGLLELSQVGDYAIVIETEILEKVDENTQKTSGHFFLLPDPDSYEIIFNALGVPIDG
ncbi:chemotaxis protein CheC [Anaerobacillus isosaccharinicus]|uniref:CheY-P-specific phosphatase CheC n=1 Tax=Anaerobacillus isosaccharinicus TaxID=1532552 RepID=A0A1S2L935_9BACI|nr:chemotaxis protein CheC [Anaerobacillus isosaccharinicus]MBA5587313.1 chemotaxis protein CheC [Anaerobacillus isosaccharinicus]QOY34494.1 chemotaxis protein CheC [Anaerobacillus isosaccharinicus]